MQQKKIVGVGTIIHFKLIFMQTSETKDLPSPMVGGQFSLNDSLAGDAVDTSLTDLDRSWLSGLSIESNSSNSTFEKYSMTATQLVRVLY